MKTITVRCRILSAAIVSITALVAASSCSETAIVTWGAATTFGDTHMSTMIGACKIGGTGVGNTTVDTVNLTRLALSGFNATSGAFATGTSNSEQLAA